MNPQLLRALKLTGFSAWFSFCFLIGCVLMFPLSGLKPLVVDQAEKALGKGKQGKNGSDPVVTIGDLATSGLGIKAERVHIQLASPNPDPGATFDFDAVRVSATLLSAITSNKTVQVQAKLANGDVDADITVNDKQEPVALVADIDDVNLARFPAFISWLGVPLEGIVNGTVDVTLGAAPEKDAKGNVDLTVKQLALGQGRLQAFPGGLDLPPDGIPLGVLRLTAPVDKGQAQVDLKLEGTSIELDTGGTVTLRNKLQQSRVDIEGWFRPTKDFLDKAPAIKSALELGEKLSLPGMPSLSKAKDSEGRYHFSAKGAAQLVKPQLSRDAGRRSSRLKGASAAPDPPMAPPVDFGKSDDE